MKQTGYSKRPRGRSFERHRQPQKNHTGETFEGKIRGNPQQAVEKYLTLARDAASSGDPVTAENYYQFADHYYRIALANRPPRSPESSDERRNRREQSSFPSEASDEKRNRSEQPSSSETPDEKRNRRELSSSPPETSDEKRNRSEQPSPSEASDEKKNRKGKPSSPPSAESPTETGVGE